MNTLLLNTADWDLCIDANGNIAVASDPYAIAQDAASAIKLFLGELWYDTTQGIPYFGQVLGQRPPLALLKQFLVGAALTVPEVTAAKCFITGFTNDRIISGQVHVTTRTGATAVSNF